MPRRTNVARTPTTFLGRGALLEVLRAHVAGGAPLVTLIGTAGAGKTRLALRWLELHADRFCLEEAGGAWFVDLTEARDLESACGAVCGALDLAPPAAQSTPELLRQIGLALAARGPTLLVLDDCEPIVAAVASAVAAWMTLAPETQFIATSRERLGVLGEQRLEVGPLQLPGEGEVDSEAVRLFIARAQLVRPGYEPEAAERAQIAELTRRLDGLPLAIELAAARMSVLDVPSLLRRMPQRFEVLADREGPLRHRTLRGAIDSSWELLRPWERAALRQCSVFAGGFSFEAAEAILDPAADPDAPPQLDVLQALCEKSLLRTYEPAETPGQTRLGLYESIRAYAAEALGETDEARAVRARHAEHYLRVGSEWAAGVTTHGGAECLCRLRLEAENLFVVHARALGTARATSGTSARSAAESACLAMVALDPVLSARGPYSTYVALLDASLAVAESAGVDGALRARVLLLRGQARRIQGRRAESRADLEAALALALDADDRRVVARAMLRLATTALFDGRIADARIALEGALHVAREVGDRASEGMLLGFQGTVAREEGLLDEAREVLEQALGVLRAVGDRRYEGIHLASLAGVLVGQERIDEALEIYQQSIAVLQSVGDERMLAHSRGSLGSLLQGLGRLDEARAQYDTALETHRRVGDRRSIGVFLGLLAGLDVERGALPDARRGYREALQILDDVGDHLNHARVLGTAGVVDALLGDAAAAEVAFARADDAARRLGAEALREAIAVQRGHLDLAARHRALRDGDLAGAEAHRAAAEARAAAVAGRPRNDDVRFALRVLRRGLDSGAPPPSRAPRDALVVDAEAAWFRPPAGDVVDLRLRRAARSLLLTLVQARVETPGRALPMEQLLAGGWPGERLIPHAGASRVYTMLTTLRNLGLRGLIVSRRDGHLLDPAIPIVVERASTG